MSDGGGDYCVASWDRVFVLKGDALVDYSRDFRDFYKRRYAELQKEIRQAKAKDLGTDSQDHICLQMEADKIQRLLGISPTAGEERALKWIKSENPFLREKAADVLLDIGNRRALAALRSPPADKDAHSSSMAKHGHN